jgi:hypothetical protein
VSARIQEIPALRCLADVRGWRSGLPRRGEPSTLAARRGGVTDLGSWPSRGGGHGSTLPVLGGWCVLDWRRRHTGFFWGGVGTNSWCTGGITQLPLWLCSREAVARIGGRSRVGFPSSRRPVPDAAVGCARGVEVGSWRVTLFRRLGVRGRALFGVRCVMRIGGVQSEMELAYAGLHQLCAGLLEGLAALPRPQRDALQVAFGLAESGPPPITSWWPWRS